MKLHNILLKVTLGAAGVFLAVTGAHAGIAGSQHDLGTGGKSQTGVNGGTAEICVFCHTPHGSSQDTQAGGIPLWNRLLPTGSSYTSYATVGTATLDGETLDVGSVSLACLSCHDGSQAMDVVINAPGSAMRDGRAGTPSYDATNGIDLNGIADDNKMSGFAAVGGDTASLKNDHPVSIEYAGGACSGVSVTAAGTCDPGSAASGDPDFHIVQFDLINSKKQFWVDTAGGTGGTREKTDMILYTRSDFAGGEGPSVECGSCHDPHNNNMGEAGAEVNFLRISNAESKVCLACHDK